MESGKGKENFFSGFKEVVVEYLKVRIELARISAYEKIAQVTAFLLSGLILTTLLFLSIFFISIMGGYYFSYLFSNNFYGFGMIALFYLLLFLLLFLTRKQGLEKFIANSVIKILFDEKRTGKDN